MRIRLLKTLRNSSLVSFHEDVAYLTPHQPGTLVFDFFLPSLIIIKGGSHCSIAVEAYKSRAAPAPFEPLPRGVTWALTEWCKDCLAWRFNNSNIRSKCIHNT